MLVALTMTACSKISDIVSGGGGGDSTPGTTQNAEVRLKAYGNFTCTANWTNRDGALGLAAGTGSGTCYSSFPGNAGSYRIQVVAQTEFDGASIYRVSVNNQSVASGVYPISTGHLVCDCPDWDVNCPDKIVSLDAGVHELKQGDIVEFYGQEDWPCGTHGAYAKWHELVFTPVK